MSARTLGLVISRRTSGTWKFRQFVDSPKWSTTTNKHKINKYNTNRHKTNKHKAVRPPSVLSDTRALGSFSMLIKLWEWSGSHPPISIQCLRQTLHAQSSAMRVWPQPLTRHLPAPWAVGTGVANTSGSRKVGCEESEGDTLGDFDNRQMKLQGSPFALAPRHCSS